MKNKIRNPRIPKKIVSIQLRKRELKKQKRKSVDDLTTSIFGMSGFTKKRYEKFWGSLHSLGVTDREIKKINKEVNEYQIRKKRI